jgi:hypothetical protein
MHNASCLVSALRVSAPAVYGDGKFVPAKRGVL